MDEKTICHECGADMIPDVRSEELTYKGHSVRIDSRGWYCSGCSEALFELEEAGRHMEAFAALRAEVDGVLTPHEVTRIRMKLGLSQRKASALLGGGPRSFQKYESGVDWITRSMANLLRLLDNDPSRLKELIPRQ